MDNQALLKLYRESADFILSKIGGLQPKIGLMLGSGCGSIADGFTDKVVIPYKEIPNFPISTVIGHSSTIAAGRLDGVDVLMLCGRFHNYEGWEPWQSTFGVRVMKLLGIERMIICNAAGGINRAFHKGDMMLIRDHISIFAPSALRGPNLDEFGTRFPDMSHVYCKDAIDLAIIAGREDGIEFKQGVYAFAQGPMFETPAEIRMFATLGADAIGMSTVMEVEAARHAGIKVMGISTITNMAAGIQTTELTHAETIAAEHSAEGNLTKVLRKMIKRWHSDACPK